MSEHVLMEVNMGFTFRGNDNILSYSHDELVVSVHV